MRIDLVCFTARGEALGRELLGRLRGDGDAATLERCGDGGRSVREWVDEKFSIAEALVFVGATGIAVRSLAGKIAAKTSDPAVAVVDDAGRFVISLLSGHIGGANELTRRIADHIGAVPVVTTATDAAGVFAVDEWARRKNIAIVNPDKIKTVSAKLLAGERVGLRSEFLVKGRLPEGIETTESECDIYVGVGTSPCTNALQLAPRIMTLGVGCRKGATAEAIEAAFGQLCKTNCLRPEAFGKVCSVDIKKDEPGLAAFCRKRGLACEVFAPAVLAAVEGEFSASAFVEAVVGVDNVCERSAVAGSGGALVVGKTVDAGIAMAAARGAYELDFSLDGEGGA